MKQINLTILKAELRDLQEVINEQMDELINFDGKIPQIEFDIIKENLRKIYEDLHLLYRLNDPVEKIIAVKQQETEKEKNEPVVKPESPREPTLFTVEDTSFTKKLQEARELNMGAGSRENIPEDIKSLIHINEKFLFINELFGGNLRDYAQAIERLNSLKEKRTTLALLDEMFVSNLWDAQSAAFKKLREIIEKRFA